MFTIAGAKKKLQSEMRESIKLRVVPNEATAASHSADTGPTLFDAELELDAPSQQSGTIANLLTEDGREALRSLASQLLELREMLKTTQTEEASEHLRNN